MLLAASAAGAQTVTEVETRGDAPKGRDRDRPAWPVYARLDTPTDRYTHGVLGPIPMFSRLNVGAQSCGACRSGSTGDEVALPDTLVFEDVAPRLWDVTGDGRPEIVVVEADVAKGARLAVWAFAAEPGQSGGDLQRLATTPFIGQPQRWLAPAGVGDFDGDGRIELAYVDRPHLARELVFVRLNGKRLQEIARAPGLTNHRIGDTEIFGGTRRCGGQDQVIVTSADGSQIMAVQLSGRDIVATPLGPLRNRTGPLPPCP